METIMLSWKFLRPITLVRAPMFLFYVLGKFWRGEKRRKKNPRECRFKKRIKQNLIHGDMFSVLQ